MRSAENKYCVEIAVVTIVCASWSDLDLDLDPAPHVSSNIPVHRGSHLVIEQHSQQLTLGMLGADLQTLLTASLSPQLWSAHPGFAQVRYLAASPHGSRVREIPLLRHGAGMHTAVWLFFVPRPSSSKL